MKSFIKYVAVILGSAVMAFGLDLFLVPSQIAPGGISGLSTVLHYLTGLPVGVLIFVLNIPVFILGAKSFSRSYILDSFFGMLMLSVFTAVFQYLAPVTSDLMLSSVFGGAFVGAGTGLVLRFGASTGGTDIMAMLLKKKFDGFSTGNFIAFIDTVIVLIAGLFFKTWETVLYSSLSLLVSSRVLDAVVEGVDYAKAVFIISEVPDEIADCISKRLLRGTTCFCGYSPYTRNEKNTLLCVVRRFEISKLKNIVYEADKNAFVIVTDTKEVLGNGFKNY